MEVGGHGGKCADISPWQLESSFFYCSFIFFHEDKYKNREENAAEKKKNSTVTNSITKLFSPDALFSKVIDPYDYSVYLYLNKIK